MIGSPATNSALGLTQTSEACGLQRGKKLSKACSKENGDAQYLFFPLLSILNKPSNL